MERQYVSSDTPKWMKHLDTFFNKVLPKKFIMFGVASAALFMSLLTGQQWLIAIGIAFGVDFAKNGLMATIRGAEKNESKEG